MSDKLIAPALTPSKSVITIVENIIIIGMIKFTGCISGFALISSSSAKSSSERFVVGHAGPPFSTLSYAFFIFPTLGITPSITSSASAIATIG